MRISSFRVKAHLVFYWCLYNKSVLTVIRVIGVIRIHLYSILLVAAYVDYSRNTPASDADTFPACQGCGLICANFDCSLIPSHLLSFVGGMVMGDYYSISAKRMMGRIEGKGRDVISPFPCFPCPPAGIFPTHPS